MTDDTQVTTVTGDDFTGACDRELVGLTSTEELQEWARESAAAAERGELQLDPDDVLRPALTELGSCEPGEVREVVRKWMPILHPPRCGA